MGTTIRVRCTDQVLTFENTPVIASGGREVDSVHFEFCGKWEGAVRTAVFWRSPTEAYHVLLDDSDTCAIPREVLQADGLIFFGVFGVYPDGRQRPTEVLTYRVVKGTITEGTKPTDPAPDIYTQLQAAYADALAKMAAYQANTERLMAEHLAEMEQTVAGYHDDNARYMAAHEQTVAAAMAQHEQTVAQQMAAHEQAVDATIGNAVAAAEQAATAANAATAAAGTKADKVKNATAGNFAGLDANGNLTDSGKKPGDIPSKEKLAALATRTEIFTKDGFFRVPDGVTSLRVMCYGGGGAGGVGSSSYTGGGGGGGYYAEENIAVAPGEVIPVTIGKGGGEEDFSTTQANDFILNGGATSFGTYLSADGGAVGGNGTSGGGSNGGSGGSGGGGGYTNISNSYANGGTGYNFGGGGAGGCHPDYTQTAAPGGSMGGAGGANASDGINGIDTTNMDVPFPGLGLGGKSFVSNGGTASGSRATYNGSGGGGGFGGNGGVGGYHSGGGGGGYGGDGGDGYPTGRSSPRLTVSYGGGGGGGYGANGRGGHGHSSYDNSSLLGYRYTFHGGIGAGGGGCGADSTRGKGGDGICTVTYTLPM